MNPFHHINTINNNNVKAEDTNRILKLQQELLDSKKQLTAKESQWQRERTQLISKNQIMNLQLIQLKQRQQHLVHINETLSIALGKTDCEGRSSKNNQQNTHLKQLKDMLSHFINIEKTNAGMSTKDKKDKQKHNESIKQISIVKTPGSKKLFGIGTQTDKINMESMPNKHQNVIDQALKQVPNKKNKAKDCQCRNKIDWYDEKIKILESFISQKQSIIKEKDSIIEDLQSQLTVLNQSLIQNNTNLFERDDEEKYLMIREELQSKFQQIYAQKIKDEVRMLENNYRDKLEDAKRKIQAKQVGRKSSNSILIYDKEDSFIGNPSQSKRHSNYNKRIEMQRNSSRGNRVTYDLDDQNYLNDQCSYLNQLDDSYSEQSQGNCDSNNLLCEYCQRVYPLQLFKKHMKRCKVAQNQQIQTLRKRQQEIQQRLIRLNQAQEHNNGPKSRRSINLSSKNSQRGIKNQVLKQGLMKQHNKSRQPLIDICQNNQNMNSQKGNKSRIDYTDSAKSRKREMMEYQLRNIMQTYREKDRRNIANGYYPQSQIVTPNSQHSGYSICDQLQQSDTPYQFY